MSLRYTNATKISSKEELFNIVSLEELTKMNDSGKFLRAVDPVSYCPQIIFEYGGKDYVVDLVVVAS